MFDVSVELYPVNGCLSALEICLFARQINSGPLLDRLAQYTREL